MIRKLLCLGRYALLAALTISHFCFFGLPALQKFQQGELNLPFQHVLITLQLVIFKPFLFNTITHLPKELYI